jgi:hypothetical protein
LARSFKAFLSSSRSVEMRSTRLWYTMLKSYNPPTYTSPLCKYKCGYICLSVQFNNIQSNKA